MEETAKWKVGANVRGEERRQLKDEKRAKKMELKKICEKRRKCGETEKVMEGLTVMYVK